MALSLFLNVITGRYKEAGLQTFNDELKSLLCVYRIRQRRTVDVQSLRAGHAIDVAHEHTSSRRIAAEAAAPLPLLPTTIRRNPAPT